MAMILAPIEERAAAVSLPTLPNPWIATVDVGRLASDVAEPLDCDRRPIYRDLHVGEVLLDEVGDARTRGLAPALRAAQRDRLARDDARRDVADMVRVRVHHPCHDLLVRAHVRRRDVELGPDEADQFLHVAPGEVFELRWGQLPG